MMTSATVFPAHLLSINSRNDTGEKEVKALFDMIESNGGWENTMGRGEKLPFLKTVNETIHTVTGSMN